MENYFVLHPKKRPPSKKKKPLEVKFGALVKSKILMSSGQILESPIPRGAKASSSTSNYYIFRALGKVVSDICDTCSIRITRPTFDYMGTCGDLIGYGK